MGGREEGRKGEVKKGEGVEGGRGMEGGGEGRDRSESINKRGKRRWWCVYK